MTIVLGREVVSGRTLRDAQKDLTRRRLVDAAIEVFEREGFRAAKIEQITKRAGANRATFYLHFRNKEDVAHDIGLRLEPELRELFRQLDDLPRPTHDEVRAWLGKMADYSNQRRTLVAVATEAHVSDRLLSVEYVTFLSGFADGMVNYLSRFPADERMTVRTRLMLQFLQMERALFVTVIQQASFPDPNLLDVLSDIWWRVLFEHAPALP